MVMLNPTYYAYKRLFEKDKDDNSEYNMTEEDISSLFTDEKQRLDTNKMVKVAKDNIKLIRLICKYSIRKFAEICKVCPQTVSNWEKGSFKFKHYWSTVLLLLSDLEMNPPDDDRCVKLITYILFGYNDFNYKENIEKIKIIAQAYKGGANQQSIEMLYSALCLDPNVCLDLTKDPTIPSFIKFMILKQFKGGN